MVRLYGGEEGYKAHQLEIATKGGKAPHSGPRGFALMNKAAHKEIAAKGGRAKRVDPS